MKTIISFLILACVSAGISVSAQIKITGRIIDYEKKTPIEFAGIKLITRDSLWVKGTSSDNCGRFFMNVADKGDYILVVSNMGYNGASLKIDRLDKNISLGDIPLSCTSIILKDISVTANAIIRKPDRKLILPTQAQVNTSDNGITLLRNLQLSRIDINPILNTITTPDGGEVQLRINGAKVTQDEIKAVRPGDVIRVEYYDVPGLRYDNAEAVIDYIVRHRKSGGNFSLGLNHALAGVGFGEDNLSFRYNYKKSEFGAAVSWRNRQIDFTRENKGRFVYPENILNRIEIGEPTLYKDNTLNFSLNYSLHQTDKYLLNIALRDRWSDIPKQFSNRKGTIYSSASELPLFVSDLSAWKENSPSLDIYFRQSLKQGQTFVFNVVGTYIHTKNNRCYRELQNNNALTDIFSYIKGNKYSVIAEGVYEKKWKIAKLSAGVKHTQSFIRNDYSGNIVASVNMNNAQTYAFMEYQFQKGKFDYMLGAGSMRIYNSQDKKKSEDYIFRPSLRITYNINKNIFLRYQGYISGYSPSLADMNQVGQMLDSLQLQQGNPDLQTVIFYNNIFTAGYNRDKWGVEFYTRYTYDHKPIMESINYTSGKFIKMKINQKGFHLINIESSVKWQPFKDYISLNIRPGVNRYISYGLDYTHARTNWYLRASLSAHYKKWFLYGEIYTHFNKLWGETISQGESLHMLSVGYNTQQWSVTAGIFNPFTKSYSIKEENLSRLIPSVSRLYTDKISRMFFLSFSYNFNFGRQYKTTGKCLDNKDSDTGILSGGQHSM